MPEETVETFVEHGRVTEISESDVSDARGVLDGLESVGLDLSDVARVLEDEGVASFAKSFDEVIDQLTAKAAQLADPA